MTDESVEVNVPVVALKLVTGEMVIGEIANVGFHDPARGFRLKEPLLYRVIPDQFGRSHSIFTRFCMMTDDAESWFDDKHIVARFNVENLKRDYYYSMLSYIKASIDPGFDADIEVGIEGVKELIAKLNEPVIPESETETSIKSMEEFFKAFGGNTDPQKFN